MDPMAIVAIAVGVGAIVYAASVRTGAEESLPDRPGDDVPGSTSGPFFEPARRRRRRRPSPAAHELGFSTEGSSEPDPGAFVYVPVLASSGPRWRDRLAGLVGLVATVVVAATLLAVGVYQAGHMANEMIERFLGR